MNLPAVDAPEQAVILVGGRTGDTPNPLVDVGGRPFLDYMIENCVRFGFRDILLSAAHHGEQVASYVEAARSRLPVGVSLDLMMEPTPRGSAGALRFARDRLAPRFLMLHGDSFLDTNWLDLMLGLEPADETMAVMTLRHVDDTSHHSVVWLDREQVTGFTERGDRTPGLVNGGVYLLDRQIVGALPDEGSLERDVLPNLCAYGMVRARVHEGFFVDLGVPELVARAQTELPRARQRAAVFFDRDGTINVDEGYTHRIEDLVFLPGAIAAVKRVNDMSRFAFLVTNQAGVARGKFTEAHVRDFHAHMRRHLRAAGAHFDDIRYCPDYPGGIVAPYNRPSSWRKPAPGMLLDLMEKWPVRRQDSLMVGDAETDIQAAEAAGVRGVLYSGGNLDEFLGERLREK